MNYCGHFASTLSLAQECGFLSVAFHEMDRASRFSRKGTRNHQPGESPAGAEVDPNACVCGKVQKLKRIGDVASPKICNGRSRDQISGALPLQQDGDKAAQTLRCFT